MHLRRANLSTAQIIEQVVAARRLLAADDAPGEGGITNVVFMVCSLALLVFYVELLLAWVFRAPC